MNEYKTVKDHDCKIADMEAGDRVSFAFCGFGVTAIIEKIINNMALATNADKHSYLIENNDPDIRIFKIERPRDRKEDGQ